MISASPSMSLINQEEPEQDDVFSPGPENGQIQFGDPLCITLEYIKIKSRKFDWFGYTSFALSASLKNWYSREASGDIILYQNDYIKAPNHTLRISTFDPKAYGSSVVYYTPAYLGDEMIFGIRALNMRRPTGILDMIAKGLTLYNPAFSVVEIGVKVLQGLCVNMVMSNFVFSISNPQVGKMAFGEGPIPAGYKITKDGKLANELGEYPNSYLVLDISKRTINQKSFDVFYSSASILSKVGDTDPTVLTKLVEDSFRLFITDQIQADPGNAAIYQKLLA